jgi:hypothetical protein
MTTESPAAKDRPTSRSAIIAFKVSRQLAGILDEMPNKSEFIRLAVEARLALLCPTCGGSGVRGSSTRSRRVRTHGPVG